MPTVTVKLPPDLDNKLEKLAGRLNKTKSVVIRLALEELLRQPGLAEKLSGYELLSEHCGQVQDLPKDLSYAGKHLKGYGE